MGRLCMFSDITNALNSGLFRSGFFVIEIGELCIGCLCMFSNLTY
jgi:hypothetical protein